MPTKIISALLNPSEVNYLFSPDSAKPPVIQAPPASVSPMASYH